MLNIEGTETQPNHIVVKSYKHYIHKYLPNTKHDPQEPKYQNFVTIVVLVIDEETRRLIYFFTASCI
jgi:hypothetical protein